MWLGTSSLLFMVSAAHCLVILLHICELVTLGHFVLPCISLQCTALHFCWAPVAPSHLLFSGHLFLWGRVL